MATVATWLRRVEAVTQSSRPIVRTSPYTLRALPNENVYFFSKRIDNSRVIRAAEPAGRAKCWATIGAFSVLAIVLITALVPRVAEIIAGYQLQSLRQEQQRLVDERRRLEVQEAALLSPARLKEIARNQNLKEPAPGQVILLDPKADGSLALNVRAK